MRRGIHCVLLVCVLGFPGISPAQVHPPTTSLTAEVPGGQTREAPVIYQGESLFTLHQKSDPSRHRIAPTQFEIA